MKWLILLLGVISNTFASVLIKLSVTEPRKLPSILDLKSLITNWPFLFGLVFYIFTFLLYALALSKFPLNIVHPVFTSGAIALVALISIILLKEQFYWTTIFGLFLVLIGVSLILIRSH